MVKETFSDEATSEGTGKERMIGFSAYTLTVPFIQYAGYTSQFDKYQFHYYSVLP